MADRFPLEGPLESCLQLRLHRDLQLIVDQPPKVVLQIGSAVIRDNVRPVGRAALLGSRVHSQIGLELPRQNFHPRRLPRAVRTQQSQNVSRSGYGQAVQLEGIRTVPMGRIDREVGRELYHRHGVPGGLLAPVDAYGAREFGHDDLLPHDVYAADLAAASGVAFEILHRLRVGFYLIGVDDDDSFFFPFTFPRLLPIHLFFRRHDDELLGVAVAMTL
mmetsp:Transcript_23246/g.56072  ORF Transcript_23246/g.56072 Transcript_23246/m.56072 type:complete len:218 (+) Transcript_23246:1533-2186(+)